MRIHLISSMRQFESDIIPVRKIAEIVRENGGFIAFNWYDGVDARKKRNNTQEDHLNWSDIVDSNTDAIVKSDALYR